MGFDVVGVQFDEARDDEVAAHVLGPDPRRAAAEINNCAVLGDEPAGLDHLVGEHQTGIGEGEGGGLIAIHVHAAAANRETSMRRSATASPCRARARSG